ncbi:MAG TPA: sugar ABC transporter ATP-binding protein [Candidatus Limiplasma pullicola]|nr:sugar ABC transporter ATP-binding protein [Candidatus Limiplasma pullicola]
MRNEVLRLEKVTLREQGVTLLDNLNLHIFEGEIMGLVPIDTHGLSALCDLLRENVPLHYGYVFYREKLINTWRSPRPHYNRISVIQAKSCLVDGLTVADNIFVLRPGFRGRLMRPSAFRRQLMPFIHSIGIPIDADARVEDLTVFERFVVELLKAVVAGSRLIVLNEISTLINEAELGKLHAILRHYAAEGVSFLYVCFHFEELLQISDRTALMMQGRVVKLLEGSEMIPQSLLPYSAPYEQMVASQLARGAHQIGGEVFSARLPEAAVGGLAFSVRAGECLVLQDLDNHFIDGFLGVLSGAHPPQGTRLLLCGRPFRPGHDRRLAVIQDQPGRTMVFPGLNYLENLCFTMDHRIPSLWRSGRVKRGLRRAYTEWLGPDLLERRVEDLTETGRCELVYRRILLQRPDVVFCVQPFRMADVAMRMSIWRLLEELLDRGVAVVILAVNLADSLSLADRLIRVRRGQPQEAFDRVHFNDLPADVPWRSLYQGIPNREKEELP